MNEVIKLLLDMGMSAQDAEKVAVALDRVKASAKGAADSYEVLGRQTGTYAVSTNQVDHALDAMVAKSLAATQAQKAMHEVLATTAASANGVVGQKGVGGRGLLGMSYAFQDFTSVLKDGGLVRALGAVGNNIDQMAMSMGMSVANAAKLSFAFSGFTAALPLVVPLLERLWDVMSGEQKGPEAVVKALDAAEERLKSIRAELEKILKSEGMEAHETRQRFEDFFQGQGGAIMGGAAKAMIASGRAGLTGEEMARTAPGATVDVGEEGATARHVLTAAESAQMRASIMNRRAVEMAGAKVGAAPTERGARDTLRALATQFPQLFPRGFAGHMGELEPEAVRAQDEDVEATEAAGQAAIDRARLRRERVAENAKGQARMKKAREDHRKEADRKKADERKAEAEANAARSKGNMKDVNATDIDERAAFELARMRGAGGITDKYGRFHEATPGQQDRELARMVAAELKQRFPGMGRMDRQGAATGVVRGAREQATEKYDANRAEIAGMARTQAMAAGMNEQQAQAMAETVVAMQITQAAMQKTMAELREVAQQARMLKRNGKAMLQGRPAQVDPGVN